MEFTGRIVADAKVSIVKGDKEVVNFTVVMNERYKPKGSDEVKEYSTFIDIAYWRGANIAKVLNKGSVVTISTKRLFPKAYPDMNGDPKATINCFANDITLVHFKKAEAPKQPEPHEITEPVDDLPF
jgi:single-strand DNA-binding protein